MHIEKYWEEQELRSLKLKSILSGMRPTIAYSKNLTFVIVLIVVFIVLSILQPAKFLSSTNLQQMAFQIPEFGVLALAMMVAMLSVVNSSAAWIFFLPS